MFLGVLFVDVVLASWGSVKPTSTAVLSAVRFTQSEISCSSASSTNASAAAAISFGVGGGVLYHQLGGIGERIIH